MTLQYEVLKSLAKAIGIKKYWLSGSTEELLEKFRNSNAKSRIPNLKDDAFEISRIEVMGFPVLKFIHKQRTDRADLFIIGSGMIMAFHPAMVKQALKFAKRPGRSCTRNAS